MDKKLILSEVILLLASVLVFRGTWLLIDAQDIMHEPWALFLSLAIGLLVSVFCINYILLKRKKQ